MTETSHSVPGQEKQPSFAKVYCKCLLGVCKNYGADDCKKYAAETVVPASPSQVQQGEGQGFQPQMGETRLSSGQMGDGCAPARRHAWAFQGGAGFVSSPTGKSGEMFTPRPPIQHQDRNTGVNLSHMGQKQQ